MTYRSSRRRPVKPGAIENVVPVGMPWIASQVLPRAGALSNSRTCSSRSSTYRAVAILPTAAPIHAFGLALLENAHAKSAEKCIQKLLHHGRFSIWASLSFREETARATVEIHLTLHKSTSIYRGSKVRSLDTARGY